jgi:ribonuclease HII
MTRVLREDPAGLSAAPGPPRGRHPGYTPRASAGLAAYERVLVRAGLSPVAGIDEAGRGACAGPLVVAAAIICPDGRTQIPGLADSKELQPPAREEVFRRLVRTAFAWHVVVIPPGEIDRLGLHVCNVTGMRRALAGLRCKPGFVLIDGFPVRGLGLPSLAMWKGDQVAACVAAASILAKVTRDRIMTDLDERHPQYGFARHKGYCTPDHGEALMDHGPCPSHRHSYANVVEAVRARGGSAPFPGLHLDPAGGAALGQAGDAARSPAMDLALAPAGDTGAELAVPAIDLASSTDIPGEVKRRSRPGLTAGACPP